MGFQTNWKPKARFPIGSPSLFMKQSDKELAQLSAEPWGMGIIEHRGMDLNIPQSPRLWPSALVESHPLGSPSSKARVLLLGGIPS